MATVKKRSSKMTGGQEVNATDLLNNFTHASRSINGIDSENLSEKSSGSAKHNYYAEMVTELQTRVRAASRKSELSVKERIELEKKGEEEAKKLSGMPADKLRASFSGFVEKIKGPSYEDAVRRVAKLTGDLQKLASTDSKAAYHALETAIHDFSAASKNKASGKKKDGKKDDEPQITKDLKLIRKVAIIEELGRDLARYADSVNPVRKRPVLREDSPFRSVLYPEEKTSKMSTADKSTAKTAETAPEMKIREGDEKSEAAAENQGSRENGGAERNTGSQHKAGEEQPLILDLRKLDTPEKIIKQRSIIEANITKRMDQINHVLNIIGNKEKNQITEADLEKVSDTNIKLFVEITAYKDLLIEMKDNLSKTFPNDKEARESHEKSIDALVKKIGDAGAYSNKRIAKIAEEKGLSVSRVPMFLHEIRDMQRDLYSIRDSSGKPIYERLGANTLFFDEGNNSQRVVKQIGEDYEEIMKRLNAKNKAVLKGYEDDYADMSELVITQLAAIGVQLRWEGRGTVGREGLWQDLSAPFVFSGESAQ